MNPILKGKVAQGKLILDQPSKYLVRLSQLEGKRIELVIRKEKSQRSLDQNSYYWGCVVEILSKFCGYEAEEMHEALKEKFLSAPEIDAHGLRKIKSTAKLNTAEFTEYLDKIKRWASQELSVYIPDPNEADYSEVVNR